MQKQQAAPSLRAFTLTSEMARDKPRLLAALEVASAAMAKVCAQWEESRWDRKETKAQYGMMCCPSGCRRRKLAKSRMPWTCTSTALGSCYCCWQVRPKHRYCPYLWLPCPYHLPFLTAEAPGRRRELLHTEVLSGAGSQDVLLPLLLLRSMGPP